MNRVTNFAIRGIYFLSSIMLACIIINASFFPSALRRDYDFPLPSIIFVILTGIMLWSMIFVIFPIIRRHNNVFNIVLVILGIVLQLCFAFGIQGYFGIDDFDIRTQVSNYLNGQRTLSDYFIYGSNNIPIVFVFTFVGKIVNYVHLNQHMTLIFNLFQCLILDGTIYAIFVVCKKKISNETASIFLVLAVIFAPLSVYTTFLYTDTISTSLALLGIVCIYKSKQLRYFFLSGFLEALAYLIKMNLIIMAISIVIIIILQVRPIDKCAKTIAIFIIAFLMVSIPTNQIIKHVSNFSTSQIEKGRFPYTFWIIMGLDNATYGQFDGNLWQEGSNKSTFEQRQRFYSANLANHFKKSNLKNLPKLFIQKMNVMYSEGDLWTATKKLNVSKIAGGACMSI